MVVDHVKTEPVPPSRRSELEIPEDREAIILKCLRKDPEKRFKSSVELAEALETTPLDRPWDDRQARDWWRLHYPQAGLTAA